MTLVTSQWVALGYLVLGVLSTHFLYVYYYRVLYNRIPTFVQYSYFVIAWLPIILIFGIVFISDSLKNLKK